ncbi:MAG: SAM-dependent methyltransferase [Chloroflexota bacterium]|nr:SAM-dependent methyltransferase [Chloroflexota bacterium]
MGGAQNQAQQDWVEWHREYDDPSSRLSQRLRVVQAHLRSAIDAHPAPLRIISMCAGEGRDVIGVLAKHARRSDISARLVEMNPDIAEVARAAASLAHLENIEVVEGDAGASDSYVGAAPAEIVLACGVFGNIVDEDVMRTVEHLPCLCAAGASVIWTRGREQARDIALTIRDWFNQYGFAEIAYEADATGFRVGVHRLAATPRPLEPGLRLFRFFR